VGWFCGVWAEWHSALCIVKPATVIAWHRKGFRLFWAWKVCRGQRGRPPLSKEIRKLIRKMSRENPLWGDPRIHGVLLKLGIDFNLQLVMFRGRCPSRHHGDKRTRSDIVFGGPAIDLSLMIFIKDIGTLDEAPV
jgi:hypothetical protein